MDFKNALVLLCVIFSINTLSAGEYVLIDALPDSVYSTLTGPDNGHLIISHTDFLPYSGPKPDGDRDLSAKIWMVWDTVYFLI